MKPISGFLMSQDEKIARIDKNELFPLKLGLLPLYLQRNGDLVEWLESRAIDRHRANARLLKRVLRLTNADDAEVSMRVNGATITDTYWVLQDGEEFTYESVRFCQNEFDQLALLGDLDSFNRANQPGFLDSRTPELTNIGSFEKCWRLEDGHWWLYKQGNQQEIFSELFIYELGKLLGFEMAHCVAWEKGIKSRDFTDAANLNYEPARSLVGDEVDYVFNYNRIKELKPAMAKAYLDILFLDTICFNMDRHTENYGFLRDSQTGEFLRMAPNFDNNIALISRGYPLDLERKNDLFIHDFLELLNEEKIDYQVPALDEDMIRQALAQVPIEVDESFIVSFILNGYRLINMKI